MPFRAARPDALDSPPRSEKRSAARSTNGRGLSQFSTMRMHCSTTTSPRTRFGRSYSDARTGGGEPQAEEPGRGPEPGQASAAVVLANCSEALAPTCAGRASQGCVPKILRGRTESAAPEQMHACEPSVRAARRTDGTKPELSVWTSFMSVCRMADRFECSRCWIHLRAKLCATANSWRSVPAS